MTTETRTGSTTPAPAVVIDLRDRPRPVGTPGRARTRRLLRLQLADVQRAALLHAQVGQRRRRAPQTVTG